MKIDIYSGFLGAGKTTLIKKMIAEAHKGEKLMLIENEFGQIGIDGGFLKDSGINITEMNSGCICCSLVGDFSKALKEAIDTYHPDRIIIEPSGVGKLSDVVKATQKVLNETVVLNGTTAVVDVNRCKIYMKNFGEFFNDQITEARCIVLSHTSSSDEKKITECIALLREKNPSATIITTDWDKLSGEQILNAIENASTLDKAIEDMKHEHHHHHHEHGDDCDCGCHDHDHHHHHHHDHGDDCDCGCHDHDHHHHHEHGDNCDCGCHDHDHHHHHHADEVFESWGVETAKKFTVDEIERILDEIEDEKEYGLVLRAKGIVDSTDGEWIYFDYIPGAIDVRRGSADVNGKVCVIGSHINEEKIRALFNI